MTDETPNQDENQLIALRREKLAALRKKGNAFPNDYKRTHYAADLQASYAEKSKDELKQQAEMVAVAGRIMARRGPFLLLQDMTGRIQAYVDRKGTTKEQLAEIDGWDIGDIIAAKGALNKSGKGDLYVQGDHLQLLTKSLRPPRRNDCRYRTGIEPLC